MAIAALVLNFLAFLVFVFANRASEKRRLQLARWGLASLILAALSLLITFVQRTAAIRFPAITGTYEGLVFLALAMDVFLIVAHRRLKAAGTGVLAASSFAAFVYLAILSSPLVPGDVVPPIPVLRSGWLVLHVAFAFVGLALFTVGALAAAIGLARGGIGTDRVRDDAIIFGYVFYAVGGLVFGAIWAEAAWGRFWGWDPKETWALITTLIYTGYLHLRYVRKAGQRASRILAIVAWVVALFTFWGVKYLFTGLHSYA